MNEVFVDFVKELSKAYKSGPIFIKRLVVLGSICALLSLSLAMFGDINKEYQSTTQPFAMVFGGSAVIFLFGVYIYQQSIKESAKEKKFEEVEQRAKENPQETQAAWELARVKLESYIDRNIKQVRSIFLLTVVTMIAGFCLISFGVYTVIDAPEKISAAIIASVSGVVVNFIGATFLVLYKSTMSQATEYVSVLERINAVGMSVQILESLEVDEDNLKQKTTAELSKQLLSLYTKA